MSLIKIESNAKLNIYDIEVEGKPMVAFQIQGYNFELNQYVAANYMCTIEYANYLGEKLIAFTNNEIQNKE